MADLYQILTLLGVFLYWVIIAAITARIIVRRRSIGVSFAWMMIIYVVPIIGIAAYFLFGELNLGQKRAQRARDMYSPYAKWFDKLYACRQYQPHALSPYAKTISDLCENRLGIPSLADNQLTLKSSPETILKTMINDVQEAQFSVHLEFYIWHPGGLANHLAHSLIDAANRGVAIKLLLDAAGSRHFFSSRWPELMRDAGVEITQALSVSPLRMLFRRLDLRLHRKIVVIDNTIAYTGSMNLVDPKYFNQDADLGEWVDVMVRITGSSVPVLNCIHAWDWEVETKQRALPAPPICQPHGDSENIDIVQVIPSGPGMPEEIIHQVLLQSIYQAKRSICITTPYFVPSESLIFALCSVAMRGVDIDIIVPDKNDSLMVEWASRSFFGELLHAGVKIHRFKGGLLHTKSVVIDQHHCLIGTVNLDMRSLWLNFEVTLAVDDIRFTQELNQLQSHYMDHSRSIDPYQWKKRPMWKRLIEQFFYLFSPLL